MGRQKTYDEQKVLEKSLQVFLKTGYEGTSLDDLVAATGLLRGSLYSAYGSKRGIFLATLKNALAHHSSYALLDIILVALLELAPRDKEIREILQNYLKNLENAEQLIAKRLIRRAGIDLGK